MVSRISPTTAAKVLLLVAFVKGLCLEVRLLRHGLLLAGQGLQVHGMVDYPVLSGHRRHSIIQPDAAAVAWQADWDSQIGQRGLLELRWLALR